MSKVRVVHENGAWMEPLRRELAALGTPHEQWFLDCGLLDLRRPPRAGVSAIGVIARHLTALDFPALAFAERPWGITSALVLRGSKVAGAPSLDAASWP
jgi:hypothetical protein